MYSKQERKNLKERAKQYDPDISMHSKSSKNVSVTKVAEYQYKVKFYGNPNSAIVLAENKKEAKKTFLKLYYKNYGKKLKEVH